MSTEAPNGVRYAAGGFNVVIGDVIVGCPIGRRLRYQTAAGARAGTLVGGLEDLAVVRDDAGDLHAIDWAELDVLQDDSMHQRDQRRPPSEQERAHEAKQREAREAERQAEREREAHRASVFRANRRIPT